MEFTSRPCDEVWHPFNNYKVVLIITFDQHKVDIANALMKAAIPIRHIRHFILSSFPLLRRRIHSLLTVIFIKTKVKSVKASKLIIIHSELTSWISEFVIKDSNIVTIEHQWIELQQIYPWYIVNLGEDYQFCISNLTNSKPLTSAKA